MYMQSTKGKAPVTTMGNKLLNKLDGEWCIPFHRNNQVWFDCCCDTA